MSKMLDVMMAGVISGIVAFTTSKMGIAGTVLGAVLGAMLFQFMSHFVKEPLENVNTKKIETRIVYAIPLIIIMVIEIIYIFAAVYWKPEQIFYFLENATDWNLFKSIWNWTYPYGNLSNFDIREYKKGIRLPNTISWCSYAIKRFIRYKFIISGFIRAVFYSIWVYNFFRSYSCIIICCYINNSRISSN